MFGLDIESKKVYRAGNDFPVHLILPIEVKAIGVDKEFGWLEEFLQADIHEDDRVEVLHLKENVGGIATHEQVEAIATAAIKDLGVVHPGVSALLNFAVENVA